LQELDGKNPGAEDSGSRSLRRRGPVPAASAALFRQGAVLLVQRRTPPYADRWTLPGGHIEFGESPAEAARRELREETGLDMENPVLCCALDFLVRGSESETHFLILVHAGHYAGGEPVLSDELSSFAWFRPDELGGLSLTPGLEDVLRQAMRLPGFGGDDDV
jgi:ADP-ribose pyrophosphatase YjhB (NUDIX family)